MARPVLTVVAGALGRGKKPKSTPSQDELARRWRLGGLGAPEPIQARDVIPLLDGWIRRLEREAGPDPAAESR